MTAPRLIRLVPTGEMFMGTELVEPCEVQPLDRKTLLSIIDQQPPNKKTGLPMFYRDQVLDICRAIEQAHGIGRRMDA